MSSIKQEHERIINQLRNHSNLASLARALDMNYQTILSVRDGREVKLTTLIKIERELNKNG